MHIVKSIKCDSHVVKSLESVKCERRSIIIYLSLTEDPSSISFLLSPHGVAWRDEHYIVISSAHSFLFSIMMRKKP